MQHDIPAVANCLSKEALGFTAIPRAGDACPAMMSGEWMSGVKVRLHPFREYAALRMGM